MTTVYDKLKIFSENIIKKVEEDCEKKLSEFSSRNNELLQVERENTLLQAKEIADSMKNKAEAEKNQIISKANMEKEHALLITKKEIFERVLADIRNKAEEFTKKPEYFEYIKTCIDKGLSEFKFDEAVIFLKPEDYENLRDSISRHVNRFWAQTMKVKIEKTNEDILGGCICQNTEGTLRVDCSMSALIEDNKDLIGKMLMDRL